MSDWLGMAAAPRTPRLELKDRVVQRAQSARRMQWSMLAAARDTLDLLRQPGGRVLMIPVTTAGRPGAMTIYADSLTRRWLVTCHHLTPNRPGEAYQLWFLTAAGALPAAMMPMDRDVPMVMTLEVPAGVGPVTGVAMSVEPRRGSPAPTSPLLFSAAL